MRRAGLVALTVFFVAGYLPGCKPSGEDSPESSTSGTSLAPGGRSKLPPGARLREIYSKGIQATKTAEGFRGKLYNDAGQNCVIGYGHLVRNGPCDGTEPREFRAGITEPRGTELLMNDMEVARQSVTSLTSGELTNGQYAALCDFAYNVGAAKLKKSTLLKTVNLRQFERVPHQFRRWVMAGGREVAGLKARRELEIELFFDGMLIPRSAPAPGEDLSPIDVGIGE